MKKVILSLAVFASVYSLQANNSVATSTLKSVDECMVCRGTGSAQVCGIGATCSEALKVLRGIQ